MSYRTYLNKSTLFCTVLIFASSLAFAEKLTGNQFPLPPRVSIAASSGTNTFGDGDAMLPLWGNPNFMIYSDVAAKYGDDSAWLTSLGLGGRKIIANDAILGAYFFGDYNKSSNANSFFVINPGIEYMNNQWDGHFNGYLPLGEKTDFMAAYTGDEVGASNTTFFKQHTQYASVFNLIENVGPGVDVEVGHTFSSLKRTRAFVGSYYFAPQYTSNITGIEAGFEMPLNYKWASVELRDSYDNVNHNTFLLTIRFSFGGLDKTGTPTIQDRMLDRIPRHLGNLNSGDGIPSEKAIVNTGRSVVVRDNIWFFIDGPPTVIQGVQNCTYEHPCVGLAQTQIDTINALAPNANFYFAPGTYNNPAVGSGFSFYAGQNVFGRTSNYQQLATGSDRPLLNDSILLNGSNSVYNVRVFANSELNVDSNGSIIVLRTGVLVPAAGTGTVNVYNSDVVANAVALNASAAINDSATATLNIYNSTLSGSMVDIAGGIVIGAGNVGSGNLNINGSTIAVTQTAAVNSFNILFGVVNNESGIINITNTNITANSNNAGLTATVLNNSAVGIGTINIARSSFSVVANNSNLAATIFNQANNGSGIGGTVNVDQTSMTLVSNNNGGGLSAGVFNTADSTVNLTNSVIDSSGNEGTVAGILNSDPLSTVNFQNNSISINLSGTALGAPTINGGTLNDNGGNQCFQNGVPAPC